MNLARGLLRIYVVLWFAWAVVALVIAVPSCEPTPRIDWSQTLTRHRAPPDFIPDSLAVPFPEAAGAEVWVPDPHPMRHRVGVVASWLGAAVLAPATLLVALTWIARGFRRTP